VWHRQVHPTEKEPKMLPTPSTAHHKRLKQLPSSQPPDLFRGVVSALLNDTVMFYYNQDIAQQLSRATQKKYPTILNFQASVSFSLIIFES